MLLSIQTKSSSKVYFVILSVFAVYENSTEYRAEIAFYVGFIENILNTVLFSDVIILGDTNFDINDANYNIVHCDDRINGPIQCT